MKGRWGGAVKRRGNEGEVGRGSEGEVGYRAQ